MKTKITFFTFIMAMALALPMYAQYTPDTIPKSGIKQQDKESMMGKPTFQATSGDLIFSIWITTQQDHKKMMMEMKENGSAMDMKGMKDMGMKKDSSSMMGKGMEMDNATKEAMMAGTHHMMVEVKNTISGKETNAISTKVEIVSPTNKNSSVDLKMPMTDHFGSGITLDEMGEYQLKVSVLVGNISKTLKLKYTVK
jgi:hypothetical protein